MAEVDKSNFEYVTIPDKDLFEYPFPGIWINTTHYKPGTHLVDPTVAGELRAILTRAAAADMRVVRPGRDRKAEITLQRASDSSYNKG